MIESRQFEYPEELFEEEEFGRLVSFSKTLGDSGSHTDSGKYVLTEEAFPQTFGNYQLTRMLGEGRLCRTFLARQQGIDQDLVIKKIHPHIARKFPLEEFEEATRRFYQESTAAGSLAPELIAPIVEFGDLDGKYFYAMEFVKGKSLSKLTNSSTFSNRLSAEVVKSVAESLHKVHRAGIFLGNIDPGNLILDTQQHPHLLVASQALLRKAGKSQTRFQAPEVSSIEDVDAAAEIWALGALLYNCLVGEPPEKTIVKPRKRNPKVARDLETICLKCLRQRPDQRYATMAELAEDLGLFLEYQPIKSSPRNFVGKLIRGISKLA